MDRDELWNALFRKVEASMDRYNRSLWRLTPSQVAGKADEIAATNLCYNELVGRMDSYPQEDVEYLLRFEDPIVVIRDQWLQEQIGDHTEAFSHALWSVRDKEAAEMDYSLDQEYAAEKPSMTQRM